MTCCYLCARWRQVGDHQTDAGLTQGKCTLWPKHIDSLAGNYCGQFVASGDWDRYSDKPQPLEWLERLNEWRKEALEAKQEVRRLKEVAKELRRKLKEKRANR